MLGMDTTFLVHFLVRNDAAPFAKANRLIKHRVNTNEPVFVSLLVLLEIEVGAA